MLGTLRLKWVFPLFVITYALYVLSVVCPQKSATSSLKQSIVRSFKYSTTTSSSSQLSSQLFDQIDSVHDLVCAQPYVSSASQHLVHLDKHYQISSTASHHFGQLTAYVAQIDEKYALSAAIDAKWTIVKQWAQHSYHHANSNVFPWLKYWSNELRLHLAVWYLKTLNLVSYKLSVYKEYCFGNHGKVSVWWNQLANSSTFSSIKSYSGFNTFIDFWYHTVLNTNINAAVKEKLHFLQDEVSKLLNAQTKGISPETAPTSNENIVDVVKDILGDVLQESDSAEDAIDSKTSSSTASQIAESTAEPAEPAEPLQPAEPEEESFPVAENDSEDQKDVVKEVDEESDTDEPPLTIHLTSTFTVTQSSSTSSSTPETSGIDVVTNDDSLSEITEFTADQKIDQEIEYWENKVTKTSKLSYNSLKTEMEPFISEILKELTEIVSANLTDIQTSNFANYKKLNELTSKIYKDAEKMKTTGDIIEHPEVSRDLVRAVIKESYEGPERALKKIEDLLNEQNSLILVKYFETIQETIDILESFAEITVQDFSNRLNALIQYLESSHDPTFDDEISWSAWKRFHKIKEEIFRIRDLIYNEAIEYQKNPAGTEVVPNGLREWIVYLKKINFHINFLLRDNEEYLKLVRAKANVAFQFREELERDLKARKLNEKALADAASEKSDEISDKNDETSEKSDDISQESGEIAEKSDETTVKGETSVQSDETTSEETFVENEIVEELIEEYSESEDESTPESASERDIDGVNDIDTDIDTNIDDEKNLD